MEEKLTMALSPHIRSNDTVDRRMWNVVIALLPAFVVALCVFGLDALWLILLCTGSAILFEWLINRYMLKRTSTTILDGSAFITGLLLAFNLPSTLPWWMALVGSLVAIGIGKMSFGGLGCNIWNPALVGRVFLLLSFPAAMTTWDAHVPSGVNAISSSTVATSGATLLQTLNDSASHLTIGDVDWVAMGLGNMNGSLGEVGSFAILLGLAYLLIRKIVTWHIPVAVIGSAALLSWALGTNPILDIFAGGLLLGACFMATDYVTSPMTHKGQLIYGVLIGVLTVIIRRFGAYPEGVSFAILLGNSVTPLINRYCRPKLFGERREKK